MKRFVSALALLAALIAPSVASAAGKTLVVATSLWPPMTMVDEEKNVIGYEMDVITAAAKAAGYDVKLVNTSWDGIFSLLESGNCDIIASCVTITDARKKNYLFSDPFYSFKQACVVPKDSNVTGMDDLKGKRVGAQIGTTGHIVLQKALPADNIGAYDDVGLAFEDLKVGRIDAVMCDDPVAAYYANRKEGYTDLMKLAFITSEGEDAGFVFRKQDEQLKNDINKGLAAIRADGTEKAIREKWMGTAE